jgi:EAL domain-containing protein (putative c-di-GMP-specific phosphodiesterase class I)
MSSLLKLFERMGRERGSSAVLELAAFAAVWPYVAGGWPRLDPVSSPLTVAGSLLITLLLLLATRAALCAAMNPSPEKSRSGNTGSTLILPASGALGEHPSADHLAGAEDLVSWLVETEFTGESGRLGVIRFVNHAPMVAFDAAGAQRIMDAFVQRLKTATGRRRMARLADDAFAIWFPQAETVIAPEELKSLGYVASQEISEAGLTVAPDIAIGVMTFPAEGHTPATFISHALASTLSLKKFSLPAKPADRAAGEGLASRFAMEQALRRAVRAGELSLRYQPLIDTAAGRVAGAEVLLRWRHATLGDVSPAVFVPLLEEIGLIHEIGLWTLNSACRQLNQWRNASHPDIRLAINLSAVQLQDPALKSAITRIVASHGLAPSDVELELTETAAMEDRDHTATLFRNLRGLGFGIVIDDFGNGHSNFGYLRSLPFSKLKIDREFVSHIDTRPGSQAICKSLIELGAGLGIAVLAEGVERAEEVTTLRRLGCHLFQGYHFARPQTAEDFTTQLADREWLATLAPDVHRARPDLRKRIMS